MKNLKVLELFGGVGCQRLGIERAGWRVESVGVSEWDVNALRSYAALHADVENRHNFARVLDKGSEYTVDGKQGVKYQNLPLKLQKEIEVLTQQTGNLGDIRRVDKLPACDVLTYSYPCQDVSIAGKQKGVGVGTRSGLLYEVERLLKSAEQLPSILVLENVTNAMRGKHAEGFSLWLRELEKLGYTNHVEVLNAVDFGMAQSRERVFVVSIHVTSSFTYSGAVRKKEKVRLQSILDKEVEEKYNVPDAKKQEILERLGQKNIKDKGEGVLVGGYQKNQGIKTDGICTCLTASMGKGGGYIPIWVQGERMRKLTPEECWKLQGFAEDEITKIRKIGMADTHMYTQVGNGIAIGVVEGIFGGISNIEN